MAIVLKPDHLVQPSHPPVPASSGWWWIAIVCALPVALPAAGSVPAAPPEWIQVHAPNLDGQTARPLRYRPDGPDFVIANGAEFFNRPLYGANTAFRVDAGDRPEFALYLPGRGGNLRLGLKSPAGAKWLHHVDRTVTR